jgi:hypothetical protein
LVILIDIAGLRGHRLERCRRGQSRPPAFIAEILVVVEENLEGTMSTPIFLTVKLCRFRGFPDRAAA